MASPASIPPDDLSHQTPLHYLALRDSASSISRLLAAHPSTALSSTSTAPGNLGQTPLMWAASSNATAAIALLLSLSAPPSPVDSRGHTALHHAAIHGHLAALHLLHRAHPPAAHAPDADGHTPLAWAARRGHTAVAAYLLSAARVDPSAPGALWRAASAGHVVVVDALLAAGADPRDADGKGGRGGGRAWAVIRASTRPRWQRTVKRYSTFGGVHVLVAAAVREFGGFGGAATGGLVCAVFYLAVVAMAVFGWRVARASPGVVTAGSGAALVARVDAALAGGGGGQDRLLSPVVYCYACLAPRPPRSKHARTTGRCVLRFDHTCPFVGNDVGAGNHRALLAFVLSVVVGGCVFLWSAVRFVAAEARGTRGGAAGMEVVGVLAARPALFVVVLFTGCGVVFSVGLLGMQAQLVTKGRTTYEELMAARAKEKHNPHCQGGWRKNVAAFIRDSAGNSVIACKTLPLSLSDSSNCSV